jgi:NADP-dependent 3-hydroxy acid dehydrogenase YdfG
VPAELESLEGRVAVVTGAASGIGYATAYRLAEVGARVHAVDLRPDVLEKKIQDCPAPLVGHTLDVTDRVAVDRLMTQIREDDGPISILVLCAGMNVAERRLDQLTQDAWDAMVAVNLTGVFACVSATLPQLRETKGHTVVIASIVASWPDDVAGATYQATKAGVLQFIRAANAEEHRNGVRFTALLPGMVNTELMDRRPVPPPRELRETAIQPDDIAATILFALGLPNRACIGELTIVPTLHQAIGQTL